MINLEWLRTFRSVYRTKSLSRAAEMLNISQPTVSQHIQALESHIGQKLFIRKSKGVIETDDGRLLNTLVSGSIESLEAAENAISQRYTKREIILTIGISAHLYKTELSHRILNFGDAVHVKFGNRQTLITDVEEGRLLYAIIPREVNTFDIICQPLFNQNLVLVQTPDIDLSFIVEQAATEKDRIAQHLTDQIWYAHDTASGYIKQFWLMTFDKKRPAIIPNYVIPNEYEVLAQLSKGSGLCVAIDTIAKPFIEKKKLKLAPMSPIYLRKMSLLSNKKKAPKEITDKIFNLLKS